MKRHIHYEAAFEHYLVARQVPYVAVDEAKRAAFRDARLKSFDFIVYSSSNTNWLIDIKGRKYGQRKRNGAPSWENWVTQEDLDGLETWEEVFGDDFRGLLVFAYWVQGDARPPAEIVHEFRGERYVLAAIDRDLYQQHARVRSPKWGTVNVSRPLFASLVRPLSELL